MSETTEEKSTSRAQDRIRALKAEVATLTADRDSWRQKFEGVAPTLERLTAERDTARTELTTAQQLAAQQLAAGRAGIWEAADLAAAQALHGVYGNGQSFGEWIAQPRDQLPPAVQGLLPTSTSVSSTAADTSTSTSTSTTTSTSTEGTDTATTTAPDTGKPPTDPGGRNPGTARAYSREQLQEISAGGELFTQLVEQHGSVMAALQHVEASMSAA